MIFNYCSPNILLVKPYPINAFIFKVESSVYKNLELVEDKTVQGRKSSLMFICKLILYYDTVNCLNLVNFEL